MTGEVLRAFLALGLRAFGGPVAHIGFFQEAFVERRQWLTSERFTELLALCQLLPGPASSQLGFAIGRERAGWLGALAAFVGFTLPSAALLFALAWHADQLRSWVGVAVVHGLKLVAVVVVARAVWVLGRKAAPDLPRLLVAVAAVILMLTAGSAVMQLLVIAGGALVGVVLLHPSSGHAERAHAARAHAERAHAPAALPRSTVLCLTLFAAGLVLAFLPSGPTASPSALAAAFYRAGALVFGGGHVVLPLLDQSLVATGWLTAEQFVAGYGATQAVPGPLFSVSAFLGATATPATPWQGALASIVGIFTPGFLLIAAALPLWNRLSQWSRAAALIAGVNAAVVGLLAAALVNPVWTSAVATTTDVMIVVVGLALHLWSRRSPLWVVALCVLSAIVLGGVREMGG